MILKKCAHCGNEFAAKLERAKFCSASCQSKAAHARKQQDPAFRNRKKANAKSHYVRTKDVRLQQVKKWKEDHPEKAVEIAARSYDKCREQIRLRDRLRRAANPEPHRIRSKRWRDLHRERTRLNAFLWGMRNPVRRRALKQAYKTRCRIAERSLVIMNMKGEIK